MTSHEKPAGPVERGPRPTRDLGRQALVNGVSAGRFELTEEDAVVMAYDGYPDVQADLRGQMSQESTVTPAPATETEQPLLERIARTRYVATVTPISRKPKRDVTTLTTEAL